MTLLTQPRTMELLKEDGLKLLIYSGKAPDTLADPNRVPLAVVNLEHDTPRAENEVLFKDAEAGIRESGFADFFHILSQEDEIALQGTVGCASTDDVIFYDPNHLRMLRGELLTIYGMLFIDHTANN